MKKYFAFFVAMIISILPFTGALADRSFDIQSYSSNDTVFKVDVSAEDDVAFIETMFKPSELAFAHKYESSYRYSSIENDILVLDYFSSNRYPLFRTWIYFNAEKPLYIHSVSFELDGNRYTFSDVGNKDRVKELENGYQESLLIKYGKNNADFFSAVSANALVYTNEMYGESKNKNAVAPKMKMIFHGLEDIEAYVPNNFWVDFILLVMPLLEEDTLSYIGDNDGTYCKTTTLEIVN